jgi:hypothetical protein
MYWVEIRLYGDRYESWVDGEYEETLPAEKVKQLYPKIATAQAQLTEPEKQQKQAEYEVLFSQWRERSTGVEYVREWVEIRRYGDRYERWADGKREEILNAERMKQLYPKIAVAQADLTVGGAQLLDMRGLLQRMQFFTDNIKK